MRHSAYEFEAKQLSDPAWSSLRRLLWYSFSMINEMVLEEVRERGFEDIRPTHATAFRCMENEGSRVTVMAERAGVTKQAMSQVVQEMVRMGYLATHPDPADKRALLVKRTRGGDKLMEAFVEADKVVEGRFWQSELVKSMLGRMLRTRGAQDNPMLRVAEQRSPYGEQDEWGNDIAMLRANLKLTPEERLRKGQQAAESLTRLLKGIKR